MCGNSTKTNYHSCMLNGIIRIIQFRTDHSHVFLLTKLKHFFKPVLCNDFHIIVKKQQIFSLRLSYCKVIDRRIIEFFFPCKDPYIWVSVFQCLIVYKGFFFHTVVLNNNDLVILPCCLLFYG